MSGPGIGGVRAWIGVTTGCSVVRIAQLAISSRIGGKKFGVLLL
jgi:hypothetical protein